MLTNSQTNRLAATETLVQVLHAEAKAYTADKPMKRLVGELADWVQDLNPLRQQVLHTPGNSAGPAATDKATEKQHLATVAAEIGGDALAYANETHHTTLQAAANYGTSVLVRMRDSLLVTTTTDLLQAVRAELLAQPDQFSEFIDDDRVTELAEAIEAFDDGKSDPQVEQSSGQGARVSLRTRFKALTTLTRGRLKPLMRKYKRRNPDFWQRIEAARKVVDRPATHASPTPPPAA